MPPRGALHARQMSTQPGPDSQIRRPRTSPGMMAKRVSVQQAVTADDEAYPEDEVEDDNIELFEYEWPDLPPIPSLKDAVSRQRVSQGISYLLPVDKGRNSINNRFRTDLRAMFLEPYASDSLQYDDSRVKLSAKVHFLSNTADTKWTRDHLRSIPMQLNADCESARKLYVHSAPAGGASSRRMGIDPNKLRKRSNLFLPVKVTKAQVSPEITRLRQEATEIIKQGLAYQDDVDEGTLKEDDHAPANSAAQVTNSLLTSPETDLDSHQSPHTKHPGHRQQQQQHHNHQQQQQKNSQHQTQHNPLLTTYGGSHLSESLGTTSLNAKLQSVHVVQEKFTDYEQLRNTVPPKPVIPSEFKSNFLSPEDNQRIWDWLHHGETMSDFDFFLSYCG